MTREESKRKTEDIITLIEKDVEPKDIAERVGCCLTKVYNTAKANGYKITKKINRKNIPIETIEAMKNDASSGMTSEEIGLKYKIPASSAKEICRGCFQKKNQFGLIGTSQNERRISERIAERLSNWEYAGNYTGTDGKCDIRCKTCGTLKTVCSQAIRHQSVRCSVCYERERVEREEERQRREEQRQKELEKRRREAILRRKEREKQKRLEHIAVFTCEVCGSMFLFDDRSKKKYCSKACSNRAHNKRKDLSRRIKIKRQMVDSDISLERLYQRDGGICYMCGRVCDWNDREVVDGTIICGDTYPSVDHVIPLSKNGKHAWANVKLACRKCNSHKRDTIIKNVGKLA